MNYKRSQFSIMNDKWQQGSQYCEFSTYTSFAHPATKRVTMLWMTALHRNKCIPMKHDMITYDFSSRSAGSSNKYWNSDSPMVLVAGADRMRVTTIVSSVVTLSGKLCTTSSSSRGTCRIECNDINLFYISVCLWHIKCMSRCGHKNTFTGIKMLIIFSKLSLFSHRNIHKSGTSSFASILCLGHNTSLPPNLALHWVLVTTSPSPQN